MVQMKFYESYEAPVVEVIEVEVEKGFAGSTEDVVENPYDSPW